MNYLHIIYNIFIILYRNKIKSICLRCFDLLHYLTYIFIKCPGHISPGWCKTKSPARPGHRAGAKKIEQANYSHYCN